MSSYAQYTIKYKNKVERDAVKSDLAAEGIPSMIYYVKPMHRQGAFCEGKYDDQDFEVTNHLCDTVLSLPMHPYLEEKDIAQIADVIKDCLQ